MAFSSKNRNFFIDCLFLIQQRVLFSFGSKLATVCLIAIDSYNIVSAKLLEKSQLVFYLTPLIRLTTYVNIHFPNYSFSYFFSFLFLFSRFLFRRFWSWSARTLGGIALFRSCIGFWQPYPQVFRFAPRSYNIILR